jgi:hypothetical protein
MEDSYEHGNKLSGSVKGGGFLDKGPSAYREVLHCKKLVYRTTLNKKVNAVAALLVTKKTKKLYFALECRQFPHAFFRSWYSQCHNLLPVPLMKT